MAISKPNYTQIPNDILDNYMNQLSGAGIKVLLKICRNTFGWQKEKDKISLSQLVDSTGLCRQSALDAVKELIKIDLIDCITRKGKTNEYTIKITLEAEPVQKVDQTSPESRPVPVYFLDTQKKDKEINQNKKGNSILFNEIDDLFKINNEKYYKDAKQAGSIANIIKRTKDKTEIFEVLNLFLNIKKNTDEKFWRSAPFTPAMAYSLWDNILEHKEDTRTICEIHGWKDKAK